MRSQPYKTLSMTTVRLRTDVCSGSNIIHSPQEVNILRVTHNAQQQEATKELSRKVSAGLLGQERAKKLKCGAGQGQPPKLWQ